MSTTTRTPDTLLPLKPADFQILLVLLDGDLHGYAIMQAVADESDGRVQLEVGSMYRIIARLTDAGLITEAKRRRAAADPRRYYQVTPFGKQVARLEAQRLADVVRSARAHQLLRDAER